MAAPASAAAETTSRTFGPGARSVADTASTVSRPTATYPATRFIRIHTRGSVRVRDVRMPSAARLPLMRTAGRAADARDRHLPNCYVLHRMTGQDSHVGNHLDHFETLNHPAEDGVLPVQMWRCSDGDEELRPVRVGAAIGHRQHAGAAESATGADVILET